MAFIAGLVFIGKAYEDRDYTQTKSKVIYSKSHGS